MMTNKMKSVINIEVKVAVLLCVLGRLQPLLPGLHEERICRRLSTDKYEHIVIDSSPEHYLETSHVR
jgi:hypothetical protein